MREEVSTQEFERFIERVSKLRAEEFIGVAYLLGVAIKDNNNEPRQLDAMLEDILDKFLTLNRKQRRRLDKLIKVGSGGKKNATKST